MTKDFRPEKKAVDSEDLAASLERDRLIRYADSDPARTIKPVHFFDKPTYPNTRQIEYNAQGQPISPRYDEVEEEPIADPKDSSAQVSVGSLSSMNPEAESVPGRPSESFVRQTSTSASAEKDSGKPREESPGKPTSSPRTPTTAGSPKLPATPPTAPKT